MKSWLRWHLLPAALTRLLPKPRPWSGAKPEKIICLRPGRLGDMIVATPLYSALKRQGGVGYLAVVCSRQNEIIIRHNPHIDCKKTANFNSVGDVLRLAGWIRRQRFDAFIDLTPGFSRTNFLIMQLCGGALLRAGVNKERIAPLYHVTVEERDTMLAGRILRLGAAVTKTEFAEEPGYEINAGEGDVRRAQEFAASQTQGRPFLLVNLSAGVAHRQWGFENYRALVGGLAGGCAERGRKILLVSYGGQQEWSHLLAAEFGSCVAVPQFPFLTTVEIIGRSRLLVSPDTSLVHAAAARGIPVVGLYTADEENYARWRPYHVPCRTVRSLSGDTIETIDPGRVRSAIAELEKETESVPILPHGKTI